MSECQFCHSEQVVRAVLSMHWEPSVRCRKNREAAYSLSDLYGYLPASFTPAQFKEGLMSYFDKEFCLDRKHDLRWHEGHGWCMLDPDPRDPEYLPPLWDPHIPMARLVGIATDQLVSKEPLNLGSLWKGNGGNEHSLLVAEALNYLGSGWQGYDAHVVAQGPGKTAPDLISTDRHIAHRILKEEVYYHEVETTGGNPDQVIRNFEKAGGRSVWFWTPDETVADRLINTLKGRSNFEIVTRFKERPKSWGRKSDGVSLGGYYYVDKENDEGVPCEPTIQTQQSTNTVATISTDSQAKSEVLEHCALLDQLGKVLTIEGKKAITLRDLNITGYPSLSLKELSQQLRQMPGLLTPTRAWSPQLRRKVTVVFPWD